MSITMNITEIQIINNNQNGLINIGKDGEEILFQVDLKHIDLTIEELQRIVTALRDLTIEKKIGGDNEG